MMSRRSGVCDVTYSDQNMRTYQVYYARPFFLKVGLAVVNGQLFAVGGFDGTTYLKTIEVYDKEANNWKLCGSMNCRRLGGGNQDF